MSESLGRQGESEPMSRAEQLAATYTAKELAALLAGNEALCAAMRDKLNTRNRALANISGGGWTGEGARKIAREALNA